MRIWKLITYILLTVLLALGASGVVNAKVASGAQNLLWTAHQADGVVNWLTHQGKSARSTTGPSESLVAAKNIPISRARYGEAADHISDAQRAGHPDVLTIARPGAPANRNASIGGLPKVPGKQLDEYPPAMFKEGGAGASVRPINPRDNTAAGACIGNACRDLPDGTRVRIKVVD